MTVLVLKTPAKASVSTLACCFAAAASGATVKVARASRGGPRGAILIADGRVYTDTAAICRVLLASGATAAEGKLEKAPASAAVDSIAEFASDWAESVAAALRSDGSSPGFELGLRALDQLARTQRGGARGIANTQNETLADVLLLAAAYPVFGGGLSAAVPAARERKAAAGWVTRALSDKNGWAQRGLTTAGVSKPADVNVDPPPKKSKGKQPKSESKKAKSASKNTARSSRRVERDVAWRPSIPPGHTAYSWRSPRPKATATNGSGKKKRKGAGVRLPKGYVPTPEVADPQEWTQGAAPAGAETPKMPVSGKRNILITSALPYVNNVPHLGNIIGCVLSADVYSRYCRLMPGINPLYVCGTDEYGTTTEMKALEEKLTEQQICDKYHKIHREIYEWFNIGFDYFGRTTTQQQTSIAQGIFKGARRNGYILEQTTQQLYDPKLKKFLADRYVEGTCPKCGFEKARGDQCDKCGSIDYNTVDLKNPVSVRSGATPIVRESTHLYLDLPKLKPRLEQHVNSANKSGVWTPNATRETESWLYKRGLRPRCITRDLKWGTPVPEKGYEDKVFYVWFDAPIGYVSITANYTPDWEQWWRNQDVELVQFMGKDNIPFHTVIFPSSCLAANDPKDPSRDFTLLRSISVCEYLQYEGGLKFSKSRGTGVFGNHAKQTGIPPAVWRYYLLSVRPETNDTEFAWSDLQARNNNELIKNFGNFVNRTVSFLNRVGGVVPACDLLDRDRELIAGINESIELYVQQFESMQIRDSLRTLLQISRRGNKLLQDEAPWELAKKDTKRMDAVLNLSTSICVLLATLSRPFMPSISDEICKQLRIPVALLRIPGETKEGKFRADFGAVPATPAEATRRGNVFVGHSIGTAAPMFKLIDDKSVEKWREKYGGAQAESSENTYDPVPLRLVAARVNEVSAHPGADHLCVLQVSVGEEFGGDRQLVSGVRNEYKDAAAELVGKTVVVVENVVASKFRGVKSAALLLCAEAKDGKTKRVLTLGPGVAPGTALKPKGAKQLTKKVKSKTFGKTPLAVSAQGTIVSGKVEFAGAAPLPEGFRGLKITI